ncbi:MAG: hypothetical protein HY897_10080 [Deltaproteobacteria bacterium]|nr:hypothetical protein [Deltaproteobacteria bacterium]
MAPLLSAFVPFGSPGRAAFLYEIRTGSPEAAPSFEASFEGAAEFASGGTGTFGRDGLYVTAPFSYSIPDGAWYDGEISIAVDLRAVLDGMRDLQIPSESAGVSLLLDGGTGRLVLPAAGGLVRIASVVTSSGGHPSAIRASFDISFHSSGPDGLAATADDPYFRFSEAWFASSPAPEELAAAGGNGGGGGGWGVDGTVDVAIAPHVVVDTGCGGDTVVDDPGPAPDSCAGDTTDDVGSGAESCAGDSTEAAADGCDCAGDAVASTVSGPNHRPARVKAHPVNRLISRYLPFFAVWIFLRAAKAALRMKKRPTACRLPPFATSSFRNRR